MPAALLKQSKGLRFLTLRRRGRPFPEIASAAGWTDACEYCSPQDCAGRSLGARRPATAFASLRSPQSAARELSHYDACGSTNRAVRCRPNNCAAPRRYLRRLAPKARPPQPPKINFAHATSTKSKQVCFCIRLIRIFDFVLDTPSRQCSNKFGIALNLFVSLLHFNKRTNLK